MTPDPPRLWDWQLELALRELSPTSFWSNFTWPQHRVVSEQKGWYKCLDSSPCFTSQNRAREFLQHWSGLWWPPNRRERRGAHSEKVERLCLCLSEQDLEEILPKSLQLSSTSIGKQSQLRYRYLDGLNAWHWKQLAKGGPYLYYWTLSLSNRSYCLLEMLSGLRYLPKHTQGLSERMLFKFQCPEISPGTI